MIRPAALSMLLLASGAVAAVYSVSYQVNKLDGELNGLNRRIIADGKAVHILRAEWAYLNQPALLQDQATRHLGMTPLAGAQIAGIGDIPHKSATDRPIQLERPARQPAAPAAPLEAPLMAGVVGPAARPEPPAAPPRAPAGKTFAAQKIPIAQPSAPLVAPGAAPSEERNPDTIKPSGFQKLMAELLQPAED